MSSWEPWRWRRGRGPPATRSHDSATPMTIDDHQNSRMIADPLHLLDCCMVSNGAIAFVLTIRGPGPGHAPTACLRAWLGAGASDLLHGPRVWVRTGVRSRSVGSHCTCAWPGWSSAISIRPKIYDCYTFTVLLTLEDYGFCAKGEGGPFVASGALDPGGSLPVNTGGGQLSAYYLWGATPLSEAVIQGRGQGGDRQAPRNDLILVSGNGGILDYHGTLILSPHRKERRDDCKEGSLRRLGTLTASRVGRLSVLRCERCAAWIPPGGPYLDPPLALSFVWRGDPRVDSHAGNRPSRHLDHRPPFPHASSTDLRARRRVWSS